MTGQGSLVAGVELGGTKCICILARGPEQVEQEVRLPTELPEQTLPAIRATINQWQERYGIAAVGIASFGPLELDPAEANFGSIVRTTKPGWSDADLLGALVPPGVPVRVQTDVNGAALAEGRWGAARGLKSWAYITVGTGVGIGSIVDGVPVVGLGHSEAGHMRVPRLHGDVWPGACSFHGDCVEGLASGPALRAAAGGDPSLLAEDHPVMERAAAALAYLCHNLVLTTLPQRILIGGGVATGREKWLAGIKERLVTSLGDYAWADRIVGDPHYVSAPALGSRAGPLGAIALALAAAAER